MYKILNTLKVKREFQQTYLKNLTILVGSSSSVHKEVIHQHHLQRFFIEENEKASKEEKKMYVNFRIWLMANFEDGIPDEKDWEAIFKLHKVRNWYTYVCSCNHYTYYRPRQSAMQTDVNLNLLLLHYVIK